MRPTTGKVLYRGQRIGGVNRDVGYITQHNNLLPWRTVERNVGVALELRGMDREDRKRSVESILKTVGLESFARRYPSQLSGGMQKRTALARTLVYNPNTLLMDEPFGALDAQLRVRLQQELLTIWERDKKTVLFVTHDLEEAIALSDRVVVFSKSPGEIIHVEQIAFKRPRNIVALRGTPEFGEVFEKLWKLLMDGAKAGAES